MKILNAKNKFLKSVLLSKKRLRATDFKSCCWKAMTTSLNSKDLILNTLKQGCTTQVPWRAKFFFAIFKRLKRTCFYTYKGCSLWRNNLNKQKFVSCWPKKSFRGPHLARRPYLMHTCYKKRINIRIYLLQWLKAWN